MIRLTVYYIIFAFHILLSLADEEKCVTNDARKPQCASNEICVNSVCLCKPGFTKLNSSSCVKNVPVSNPVPSPAPYGPMSDPPSDGAHSHVAAAVVIPILLILVVIGAVVLVRKYNLVGWVRNKIHQRQTPYDEVMIGQDDDDPPLSGV